jgi:hypothetical protein
MPVGSELLLIKELSFTLQNAVRHTGNLLYTDLRAQNLEGATVEVREVPLDYVDQAPGLESLTGTDDTVWYRGQVIRAGSVNSTSFTLLCQTERFSVLSPIIANTIAEVDPLDFGKHANHIYGKVAKAPAIGWIVGGATTLAEPLDAAATGNHEVSDTTTFAASGTCHISGEYMDFTKSGTALNFSNRGKTDPASNLTSDVKHAAGETVIELVTSATFVFTGHEVNAIGNLYIFNPYNQQIVKINEADYAGGEITKTVANTTLISGETVATVVFTTAGMSNLLAFLAIQADVTSQPVQNHATTTTISGEQATGGSSSLMRDKNLGTGVDMGGGGGEPTALNNTFPVPGGDIQEVTANLFLAEFTASGTFAVKIGDEEVGLIDAASAPDPSWFSFRKIFPIAGGNENKIEIVTKVSTPECSVREIERDVTYDLPQPNRIVDVAIEALSVGYGLRLFADIDGQEAVDSSYTVVSGNLLELPSDILRHYIQERIGSTCDTEWDEAEQGAIAMGFVEAELGGTFEQIMGRVAFESGGQVIPFEKPSGTEYRYFRATRQSEGVYVWDLPATFPLLDDYQEASEESRDLSGIYTRWRFIWDIAREVNYLTTSTSLEDLYKGFLQADVDVSDVGGVTTTNLEDAEKQYGRQDHEIFSFRTGAFDAAGGGDGKELVNREASYYIQESLRVAATITFTGIPWSIGYQIEVGDILEGVVDWWSAKRKMKVLGYTKDWESQFVTVIAIEVP